MNGQAYPSTPTPIPPQRYNTDWNYTILLLPYYYLLPTFEGSDGKIWHNRIEMKTLWDNCISVFVILWKKQYQISREGVIIERPLNDLFHDRRDMILMSRMAVINIFLTVAVI